MADSPADRSRGPRNHLLWIGPLIAIPGFLSYYVFFSRFPVFRDTAWLNIGILLGATAISVAGLRRGWGRGSLQRVAGVASLAVSGFLTGLLITYCYVLSYQLPDANLAVAEGAPMPAITLASYDGRDVDLGEAGESMVLVFYRGFW